MESTRAKSIGPRPFADLIPHLVASGILQKDTAREMTWRTPQKKAQRGETLAPAFVPLPISKLKNHLKGFKTMSPKRHKSTSAMKKRWNSSVKCEEKRNHQNGPSKQALLKVRRGLNFKAKSNNATNYDTVPVNRPESQLEVKTKSRISGVCKIAATPMDNFKKPVSKVTTLKDKENFSRDNNKIKNGNVRSTLCLNVHDTAKSCKVLQKEIKEEIPTITELHTEKRDLDSILESPINNSVDKLKYLKKLENQTKKDIKRINNMIESRRHMIRLIKKSIEIEIGN